MISSQTLDLTFLVGTLLRKNLRNVITLWNVKMLLILLSFIQFTDE